MIQNIIQNNETILGNKFNMNLSSVNKLLPFVPWPQKLQKYPNGFKFVITAVKYFVKPRIEC